MSIFSSSRARGRFSFILLHHIIKKTSASGLTLIVTPIHIRSHLFFSLRESGLDWFLARQDDLSRLMYISTQVSSSYVLRLRFLFAMYVAVLCLKSLCFLQLRMLPDA